MTKAGSTGRPDVDLAIYYLNDFIEVLDGSARLTDGTIVVRVNDYTPRRLAQIRDILIHYTQPPAAKTHQEPQP